MPGSHAGEPRGVQHHHGRFIHLGNRVAEHGRQQLRMEGNHLGEGLPTVRGLLLTLDVAWRVGGVGGTGGVFTTTIPVDLGLTWPQNLANGRAAVEAAVAQAAGVAITQYRFQMV